ncbi:RAD51-associated protein 2 [Tamandua tetradactyla]|uniref:RAD51-associated protein 2 n=1 Tax=Tamandua tetradactyla TaxID=48850 RepID=UPI004053DC02
MSLLPHRPRLAEFGRRAATPPAEAPTAEAAEAAEAPSSPRPGRGAPCGVGATTPGAAEVEKARELARDAVPAEETRGAPEEPLPGDPLRPGAGRPRTPAGPDVGRPLGRDSHGLLRRPGAKREQAEPAGEERPSPQAPGGAGGEGGRPAQPGVPADGSGRPRPASSGPRGGPGPAPRPGPWGPLIRTPGPWGPRIRTPGPWGPRIRTLSPWGPLTRTPGPCGPPTRTPGSSGPPIRTPGPWGPLTRTPGPWGPRIRALSSSGPPTRTPGPWGPPIRTLSPWGPRIRALGSSGPPTRTPGPWGPPIRTPGPWGPSVSAPGPTSDPFSRTKVECKLEEYMFKWTVYLNYQKDIVENHTAHLVRISTFSSMLEENRKPMVKKRKRLKPEHALEGCEKETTNSSSRAAQNAHFPIFDTYEKIPLIDPDDVDELSLMKELGYKNEHCPEQVVNVENLAHFSPITVKTNPNFCSQFTQNNGRSIRENFCDLNMCQQDLGTERPQEHGESAGRGEALPRAGQQAVHTSTPLTSIVHTSTLHTSPMHTSTPHTSTLHTSTPHTSTAHTNTTHTSTPHTSTLHTSTAHTNTAHTSTLHTSTLHTSTPHTNTAHSSTPHTSTPHTSTADTSTLHTTVHTSTAHSSTVHSSTVHSSTPHTSNVHTSTLHSSTPYTSTADTSTPHTNMLHTSTPHSSTMHTSTTTPGHMLGLSNLPGGRKERKQVLISKEEIKITQSLTNSHHYSVHKDIETEKKEKGGSSSLNSTFSVWSVSLMNKTLNVDDAILLKNQTCANENNIADKNQFESILQESELANSKCFYPNNGSTECVNHHLETDLSAGNKECFQDLTAKCLLTEALMIRKDFEMKSKFDLVLKELQMFHEISEDKEILSTVETNNGQENCLGENEDSLLKKEAEKDYEKRASLLWDTTAGPAVRRRHPSSFQWRGVPRAGARGLPQAHCCPPAVGEEPLHPTSREDCEKSFPQRNALFSDECKEEKLNYSLNRGTRNRTRITDMAGSNFSHGISRVYPLKTCSRPIRIGLSRKAKLKQLHPYLK